LKPKFIPSSAAAANKIPNMTIRIPEDGRTIVKAINTNPQPTIASAWPMWLKNP
jgi:hypothetical protein